MFPTKPLLASDDIQELYYVTDINNVASILDKGILSHEKAKLIPHIDISDPKIQHLRKNKMISRPDQKDIPLWSCVCLFAQPHNAMVYVSRGKNICILRIDRKLLKRGDIIISNRNASCHQTKFYSTSSWNLTSKTAECLYSRCSLPPKLSTLKIHDYKAIRQLEILCPNKIAPNYITGFFVKRAHDMQTISNILKGAIRSLPIHINENIFFLSKTLKLKTFMPLNNNEKTTEKVENQVLQSDNEVLIEAINKMSVC